MEEEGKSETILLNTITVHRNFNWKGALLQNAFLPGMDWGVDGGSNNEALVLTSRKAACGDRYEKWAN